MNEYQKEHINNLMARAFENATSKMLSDNPFIRDRGHEQFGYFNGMEEVLLTLGFSITHDKETGVPKVV